MVRMVATRDFSYMAGSMQLKPGDEFEAEEMHARILEVADRANRKPADPPKDPPPPKTNSEEKPAAAPRRRGRYNRTDMRAEK